MNLNSHDELVFTVAVDYTDRSLTPEGFRSFRTHVDVLASSDSEAHLVAAQLVAAIRGNLDGMVIATAVVDVVA